MSYNPFHLGWFMGGYRVHGWQDPWIGVHARTAMLPDFYVDFVRSLERACFDFFICADSAQIPDAWQGTRDWYLRNAYSAPKYDPAVLMAILSQSTSHLGIVPTLSVTEYPPYLLARMVSTLDHVSKGRAGWNSVTSSSDRAAQNYGFDAQPDHDMRYEMAEEFTELVLQLWDSWEPDAVLVDQEAGVFADPAKVHAVNFEGKFYRSRGPINSGRAPQGRPVIVQAGGSESGRAYGSRFADVILASSGSIEGMKQYRDDVRERARSHGRNPDECKVMFIVSPILGETHAEAEDRLRRRLDWAAANPEYRLAGMGYTTDIDFAALEFDVPISTIASQMTTNGHQSSIDAFIAANGHRTLREVGASSAGGSHQMGLMGTPDEVAAKMGEIMHEVGGDGFLFSFETVTRRSVTEVTDGLVPALQRRGLTRSAYAHDQFRQNMLEF